MLIIIGGEGTPPLSSHVVKSGLSRRQRRNCRKREKGEAENKQPLNVPDKSVDSIAGNPIGLPSTASLSSNSLSSLGSGKDNSSSAGISCKKRSSVPLKERDGYGKYATLQTYELLCGMTDQQIYYWIYRY